MKSFLYLAKRTRKVTGLKGPLCHLDACHCHNPKAAHVGAVRVTKKQARDSSLDKVTSPKNTIHSGWEAVVNI